MDPGSRKQLRAEYRHQLASIRRQGIIQLQPADACDRRSCVRAKMVEIHAERVGGAPEMSPLDVQPQRRRPQLGEVIGLAGKPDDDVRLEAIDVPRHRLREGT